LDVIWMRGWYKAFIALALHHYPAELSDLQKRSQRILH
jgi:hypothetical protein